MSEYRGIRPILVFVLRFSIASSILLPLWWLAAPTYGWLLIQGCGTVLRTVLGVPVTAGHIDVSGIMNTESTLVLYVGERTSTMKFVHLISNFPPFVALILATPRLGLGRRVSSIFLGGTVLCGGHALFIVLALRFAAPLQRVPEIPSAAAQFFLTLPFLLWVVLAFWQRPGESKKAD
jgi:hypothetical protein